MSGFDFGSLRDPDAPQPDSHHRDAVEARAHELRAKTRRNWTILSALAVVVVVASVAGIVATRPNEDQVTVKNPSSTTTTTVAPTPHASIDHRFIPPTTTEGGLVVLPVTQPDGETYTLRYPPAMRIAQLGFRGGIGVSGAGGTEVQIDYATIRDLYVDSKPLAQYRGANGATVPVFPGYRPIGINGPPPDDELAFQFGPWLVRVSVAGKTDAQRSTWARNLTATLDANGYLLLHASAPLSMNNEFEGGFGNGERGNFVALASHLYCGQPESYTSVPTRFTNGDGTTGVAWCDGDLLVHAKGSSSFIDLAATELKVSPLTPPSSSPTTTSTTTPTPTNAPAISASFVSPSHGWVLQRDGSVAETTDGGMNWRTVGSLAGHLDNTQIRFADSLHGFAFSVVPNGGAPLWSTEDGGAHWSAVNTPFFPDVFDLAISRGQVYVVSMQQKDSILRIWSSPANQLHWSEDPLLIRPGAGPVISIHLVLSGNRGWLIEDDRTVVAGAQLSSSGRWLDWNPPCANAGGPALFTASSGNDLVAVCDEGVWTGPKITPAVYFSHDAGATFQRHAAPGFGEIASPNATAAVVFENGVLRRTTDEGASWTEVAREGRGLNVSGTPDLGFTTATQGFVIFGSGQMLMTYDAGATWSAVTLP